MLAVLALASMTAVADEESKPEFVIDAGGHTGIVNDIACSSDGKTVASASDDKTIRIWSAEDGECVRVLRGHRRGVVAVRYSANGQPLVSTSSDGTVRIWNIATGETETVLRSPNCGSSFDISKDGTMIAVGGEGAISVVSLPSGETRELTGHTKPVTALHFSPDGTRLVSTSYDQTARIWDVKTGSCSYVWQHDHVVTGTAITPDGQPAATVGFSKKLLLWDINRDNPIASIDMSPFGGNRCCFNSTGSEVYVAEALMEKSSISPHGSEE